MQYSYLLQELQIQCTTCSGLCCYALYLCKGESFAQDKQAGVACPHLQKDFRCSTYRSLHQNHMKGCTIYDCFGAGQYVTQTIYKNKSWQSNPSLSLEICNVFPRIQQLHQVLYYLVLASLLPVAFPYIPTLQQHIEKALHIRSLSVSQLLDVDIYLFQTECNQVLKQITLDIKQVYPDAKHITSAIKKDYKNRNLNGYDFTMSVLIATNFENCTLSYTNFLGADLRDANIAGADLRESLFLTQIQVNSTKGNAKTKLPSYVKYPTSWKNGILKKG